MSVVKKILFIGAIIIMYKALSFEDKIQLKEIVKTKVTKYKPKIVKVIDLLDLYTTEPHGIRNESIDYHEKLVSLVDSINELNDDELIKDIDDIFNFKSKKNSKKKSSKNVVTKKVINKV